MNFWLRNLLAKPVLWASEKFTSAPDRHKVFQELSDLLACIQQGDKKAGQLIKFSISTDKFIIFSDQHKGAKDGADDFLLCEPNYLAALEYYFQNNYFFISLGDGEELWKNTLASVKNKQKPSFEKESQFLPLRFIKIFGNHDLFWQNDPLAHIQLRSIYGSDFRVNEGVVLETTVDGKQVQIFCAHGHQGDKLSDGNWFSKFFVSKIWGPLQELLRINPNTPAYDDELKTLHNSIMYDWSAAQKNTILITGHTHQPVFESMTEIERLYMKLQVAKENHDDKSINDLQKQILGKKFEYPNLSANFLSLTPSYFNSGCCCYNDGDISGIEIEAGCIRLIKWKTNEGRPTRVLMEESPLKKVFEKLNGTK